MTDEIKELKKQVEELKKELEVAQSFHKVAAKERDYERTLCDQYKKENTELQRELSVHNFLDTGVPQERLDYQRELKKEIIRLKSLCRRSADEIRDLDNIIIKLHDQFPEVKKELNWNSDGYWAGEASINLLNRLDGRTKGSYVENYEDLLSEMKAIDRE